MTLQVVLPFLLCVELTCKVLKISCGYKSQIKIRL